MADNYLEKRFEDVFGAGARARYSGNKSAASKKTTPPLDSLLHKARSTRKFDPSYQPSREDVLGILRVAALLPSSRNRQALRFRAVLPPAEAGSGPDRRAEISKRIRLSGLPPQEGTEPQAYIVICNTLPDDRLTAMDAGIALEAMMLKASETGLSGCIVCNMDADGIKEALELPFRPIAVLCLGKAAQSSFLKPVKAGENLNYYDRDGVHYVPKLQLEDLLI